MWEPHRAERYEREIRAIGKAVTDPEDLRILLEIFKMENEVKAEAVRRLKKAGYSNMDIARATGLSEMAIRKWQKHVPNPTPLYTRAHGIQATDATHETPGAETEESRD